MTDMPKDMSEAKRLVTQLRGRVAELRAAMQEFVDRVDAGQVRSTYTYQHFRALLATETPALNPWREAVIDAATVIHMDVNEEDPRASIEKIISWHVAVALDPAVSSDAEALVQRGRIERALDDANRDAIGQFLAALQSGQVKLNVIEDASLPADTVVVDGVCRITGITPEWIRQAVDREGDADIEAGGCPCWKCINERGGMSFGNQWMVLCAICGNKRCPHAKDHDNACTNSNEPGQPGSAYP